MLHLYLNKCNFISVYFILIKHFDLSVTLNNNKANYIFNFYQ